MKVLSSVPFEVICSFSLTFHMHPKHLKHELDIHSVMQQRSSCLAMTDVVFGMERQDCWVSHQTCSDVHFRRSSMEPIGWIVWG